MSHPIALITDSTCDIPADWIQQYDITVVPMNIIFGDKQYLDGIELTAEQFYQLLSTEKRHPSTSQPSPQAFLDAYRQVVAKGAEQILVITISKAMSGTLDSAEQAAQDFPIPVHTVNGQNNSMGLGWQLIVAARVRQAGGGVDAMLEVARQVREDMVYYISLDTIEYLARGGRISEAAKFLGSFLQIKPLIYVRAETGTVGASIPARSRKSAIEGLYKEFFRHINTNRPLHITVLHNDALPEAEALAERVRAEYAPQELFISIVCPALGAHTGPRAIALCGYAER
jgi:DegV family protein with EDD domain